MSIDCMRVLEYVGVAISGLIFQYGGSIEIDRSRSQVFQGPIRDISDLGIRQRKEKEFPCDVYLIWTVKDKAQVWRDFIEPWLNQHKLYIETMHSGTSKEGVSKLELLLRYDKNT